MWFIMRYNCLTVFGYESRSINTTFNFYLSADAEKMFVEKLPFSSFSSYDHPGQHHHHHHHMIYLEHQYCACPVSTILWWELYCTCPHFMNFNRTCASKSEALKTTFLNLLCLIRKLFLLEMLLWFYFHTLMMHSLLIRLVLANILCFSTGSKGAFLLQTLSCDNILSFICVCPDDNNFFQAVLHLSLVLLIPRLCVRVCVSSREQKVVDTVGCLRWLLGSKVRLC